MSGRGRHGHHARGARNGHWRGGLPVSRGYVLVPVPPGHPLRMASGYAYEHRLVAAEVAGRPLLPGEHVHHQAGRADNAPELLAVKSGGEHLREHARARTREANGRFAPERRCP